jgi:HAD superfamily hydrolase (TIGR01509 family)
MSIAALIFDFDGVIADSETIANRVLAETVSALGAPTTLEQSLGRYQGRRWPEVIALIEERLGRPAPPGFAESLKAATLDRFRAELREVEGAADFIRHFAHLPRCIASSSSADRLRVSLDLLGLAPLFEGRIFSADRVPRGKPHPDLFLFAAERLGVPPIRCLVIEDSAGGVRAGVAAGMTMLGLCAASHLKPGHDACLREAGAGHIAHSWAEARALVTALL